MDKDLLSMNSLQFFRSKRLLNASSYLFSKLLEERAVQRDAMHKQATEQARAEIWLRKALLTLAGTEIYINFHLYLFWIDSCSDHTVDEWEIDGTIHRLAWLWTWRMKQYWHPASSGHQITFYQTACSLCYTDSHWPCWVVWSRLMKSKIFLSIIKVIGTDSLVKSSNFPSARLLWRGKRRDTALKFQNWLNNQCCG